MARLRFALVSPLCIGSLLLAVSGCGPSYPACSKDEDCNRDKPRNELCVNQKCQQCRNDADCAKGKKCDKGRCDPIPGYCDDDRGCQEGAVCLDHACKPCASDEQCGEGGKCKKGKCLRKGSCQSDDDCPQDQDCKQGTCVSAAPKKASQEASCNVRAVFFDYNEAELSNTAKETIDADAACIKQVGRSVQLIGRSDPRGTVEYNLALSERRAQSVKDHLMRLGVEGSKLRTLPKGELEATGKDEAGWANDRRVDFEWQ